jgi:hypothetical protein
MIPELRAWQEIHPPTDRLRGGMVLIHAEGTTISLCLTRQDPLREDWASFKCPPANPLLIPK